MISVWLDAQQGPGLWGNLLLMVGVIAIFYVFLVLPQQKRNRKEKEFREALRKGDSVITIGGLHGKIVHMSDNTITLEVNDEKTKLTFERTAIRLNDGK